METENPSPTCLDSLCYVSDHTGFVGTIKNTPADFVVTEIDDSGRLVTRDDADRSEERIQAEGNQSRSRHDNGKKQHTDSQDSPGRFTGTIACVSDTGDLSSGELKSVDGHVHVCDTGSILGSVLDVSVLNSLNHFVASIKSAWTAQTSEADQQELSLGFFSEKNERANIHRNVRKTFPVLITFTKSTELLVKPNLDYRELCQLTSEAEADEFFTFLDAKVENSRFTFQPDDCKAHRTCIHHFINKKFGKLLETKSFSEKDTSGLAKAAITVRFRARKGSYMKRHRAEDADNHNVYTAFTLRKENVETLEAISCLATLLDVLPSDFSYAGIKDKKAVTYQAMVVKKVHPESLRRIEGLIERKGMIIYNIRPVKQHLHLGQLNGNRFHIVVRDVSNHSCDSSASVQQRIEEAICNVKVKGFINYYGPQRFGRGQAHKIGLALLKEKMDIAVTLLFTPDAADDVVNKAKRYFVQTDDVKGSLALMPDYKVRERMMLRALNSKIWNEAASYRIRTYGSEVVEGDLVFCDQRTNQVSSLSDRVHIVTSTEAEARIYSINNVLLPMPGHSITYPANKVGDWYREALDKEGLQACKYRVSPLQLNIPGCYRHILKHPLNLTFQINEESDNQESESTDSTKTYLTLNMDLESSCYATVCFREMMKCNF
uniref:Pseudouridylate synthase PUS7L n=1 Tax=Leptobrachium leishanense TaxID=445787 RepID=A0A8C5PG92_9ANUR